MHTLQKKAEHVLEICRAAGIWVYTAESCTAGLLGAVLTAAKGSSATFQGGCITYSNAMKTRLLGVAPDLIATHGAVSAPVAEAMAKGGLERMHAPAAAGGPRGICLSITGIAGPGGGTPEKPVGLVYTGLAMEGQETHVEENRFKGERAEIRLAAVENALNLIIQAVPARK